MKTFLTFSLWLYLAIKKYLKFSGIVGENTVHGIVYCLFEVPNIRRNAWNPQGRRLQQRERVRAGGGRAHLRLGRQGGQELLAQLQKLGLIVEDEDFVLCAHAR